MGDLAGVVSIWGYGVWALSCCVVAAVVELVLESTSERLELVFAGFLRLDGRAACGAVRVSSGLGIAPRALITDRAVARVGRWGRMEEVGPILELKDSV